MQSTFDGNVSTMEKDHGFARESLDEDNRLLEERPLHHWTKVVIPGIILHTADARRLRWVWAIELLWLVFASMMCGMELSDFCVLTDSLMPVCRYCGTITFLMWLMPLIMLWFFNLYTYVLLVSRGVHFSIRSPKKIMNHFNLPKGAEGAGLLFALLSTIMLFWIFAGLGPIVSSNKCYRGLNRQHKVEVSSYMWWTSCATCLLYFPLFHYGRQ